MIIIKKLLLFICLFLPFNTLEVNSNDDKILLYERENLYEEDYYVVYFDKVNSYILKDVLSKLDIYVSSYTIDNKKYYVNDIDELIDKYIEDKSLEEKIYYESRGIYIDSINIICDKNELIKFEKEIHIY